MVSGLDTCQNLPLKSQGPRSVHILRMISSASRVMSRLAPDMPSTWNIAQSLGRPEAATPKFSRPPDKWSSMATRFANSAGW